ncbi:hypothetical protein DERF_015057 [Dermatophagoides farinae]|uniref:Uncharacterized protein n=1 Tax=Dermatophagoides farinae TaxID=6954 RepID=A0A922L1V0_DERFA|nr:hypothetical protein DERF_015057 [Dermatophagoides farinae]
MSDDLSKRRALRIKITKASRQLIVLSLEQLLSLQYEYDIVSELCLLENQQDYDEQRSKDDLYKQKIEALIAFEQKKAAKSLMLKCAEKLSDIWILDSGCTSHTTIDKNLLMDQEDKQIEFELANGNTITSEKNW